MNNGTVYTDEILKRLNPAVLTAGAGLNGSAAMGDPDAVRLAEALMKGAAAKENGGTVLPDMPENDRNTLIKFSRAISSAILARYSITNRLFDILKMRSFVDIGCGCTQRGIAFARKAGVKYYGIDLPAVTELLIPAVSSVIGAIQVYNRITYHTVDATDRNSLRSVIQGRSPLFISTEGVMMYLTIPEAISVTDNICSLLEEFGGVWVTADPEMSRLNDRVIKTVFGEDAGRVTAMISDIFGKSAKGNIYNNGLTADNGANADAFLAEHGFDVRRVPAADLLEGTDINGDDLREIYKDINFRIMTSKTRYERIRSPQRGESMNIGIEYGEEETIMNVSGRIDTITAPMLIEEYEKLKTKTTLNKLVIDMGNVVYVSSAGIRALLIIFKERGSEAFALANLTPEVSEIFHTTGLSDVL